MFVPPNCGALVLIAVKLPRSLWFTPYKNRNQNHIRRIIHFQPTDGAVSDISKPRFQVILKQDHSPTYHWRIAKTFDCLKDATTYGTHCKGPSTVIHNSPGAKNGRKKRWPCFSCMNHKTLVSPVSGATDDNAESSATNKHSAPKHRQR